MNNNSNGHQANPNDHRGGVIALAPQNGSPVDDPAYQVHQQVLLRDYFGTLTLLAVLGTRRADGGRNGCQSEDS